MALLSSIALTTLAALFCILAAPAHGAEECTAGTFSCSAECKEVLFCLSNADQVVVDTCADGWVCNATAHECVQGGLCTTPPDPDTFDCHDFGYFPNPYDCTKYHLCLTNNNSADQNFDCPEGSAYNALDTRCSLPADSRPCLEGPVPPCTSPGQVGAQPENNNIYYVCVRNEDDVVVPSLYKCPSDEVFVGNKCEQGRKLLPVYNL